MDEGGRIEHSKEGWNREHGHGGAEGDEEKRMVGTGLCWETQQRDYQKESKYLRSMTHQGQPVKHGPTGSDHGCGRSIHTMGTKANSVLVSCPPGSLLRPHDCINLRLH